MSTLARATTVARATRVPTRYWSGQKTGRFNRMTTLDLKSVKVPPGPTDTLPYRTMLALMDAADRLGGEDPVLSTPLSDQELQAYLRERPLT